LKSSLPGRPGGPAAQPDKAASVSPSKTSRNFEITFFPPEQRWDEIAIHRQMGQQMPALERVIAKVFTRICG
jgi:hypothetical protein